MSDDDRYRAAPVREARARAETASRGALADAVGAARAAEQVVAAAHEREVAARTRLAQAIAARDREPKAAVRALADRHVAWLRHAVDAAADAAERARAGLAASARTVDAAQRALARTRADREVIERHFEAWRQGRKKLAERRED